MTDPAATAVDELLDDVRVDVASTTPPFEQVRLAIAAAVSDGRLPVGTRLPTVRALAQRLGLAVNTVARVYRELEADGVVRTEGRRGTFVGATATAAPDLRAAAASYAASARAAGIGLTEAQLLVERAWPRD